MDKIADSIINMADEWLTNNKSRAAVVIVGDMETKLTSALFGGSDNQIKTLLMNYMLRNKTVARLIKEVAEDYDEAADFYINSLKETTAS